MTWQDISTAPKDGTEFDGWNGSERVPNVSWDANSLNDDDEVVGGWWRKFDTDGCIFWERIAGPTHWMPLPDPPQGL